MSRNAYTRTAHKEEAVRITRRQKALTALAIELHRTKNTEVPVPPAINETKVRRQARLANNKRCKPEHFSTTGSDQS